MAFSRGPSIITDGLVFTLDALNHKSYNGSGTTWYDLSSGNYNATLNNTPTYSSDGYFTFNGTDEYTTQSSLPSINTSTDSYSIELWFKFITLPTGDIQDGLGNGGPIYGERYGTNYQLFAYGASSGLSNLGVCYDDSRYNSSHRSNASISAGEWVQFVHIGTPMGDGTPRGKFTYYINGVLDTAATISSDSNGYSIPTTFHIAHDARYSTEFSNLSIAALRRYNYALTADQVAINYNALKSRFGL